MLEKSAISNLEKVLIEQYDLKRHKIEINADEYQQNLTPLKARKVQKKNLNLIAMSAAGRRRTGIMKNKASNGLPLSI